MHFFPQPKSIALLIALLLQPIEVQRTTTVHQFEPVGRSVCIIDDHDNDGGKSVQKSGSERVVVCCGVVVCSLLTTGSFRGVGLVSKRCFAGSVLDTNSGLKIVCGYNLKS